MNPIANLTFGNGFLPLSLPFADTNGSAFPAASSASRQPFEGTILNFIVDIAPVNP
jgi:hypothetical protein